MRCDVCRRYATLKLAGLHDVDNRTKTFSCSRCGAEAYLCIVNPSHETGMEDYRLDEIEQPQRHPDAVRRLTGLSLLKSPTDHGIGSRTMAFARGNCRPRRRSAARRLRRFRQTVYAARRS
jgi:hypothetical protein